MNRNRRLSGLMIILFSIIILMIGVHEVKRRGYALTYQSTSSMPKGFYLVKPIKTVNLKDIVIFRPKEPVLSFLLKRHWIPNNGWMMKYVIGMPGDDVCQKEGSIWMNHKKIGPVYRFYGKDILPNQSFCGKLKEHQYLLMSNQVERSFDGRYLGPTEYNEIIGQAIPLFIRDVS